MSADAKRDEPGVLDRHIGNRPILQQLQTPGTAAGDHYRSGYFNWPNLGWKGYYIMKILFLRVENIKKIKVVEVTPDGTMNLITGKNDQGKSTLIDAISYLFEGKRVLPDKVLREGTERGMILAETETYLIKKVVTAKDTYLSVESKDGAEYKSPQQLLNKLVGDISFDIMDFAKKTAKEQLQIITKLAGIDHTKENSDIATMQESAKELRRDLAQAKAIIGSREINKELPQNEDKYEELQAQIEEIEAENKKIEQITEFRINTIQAIDQANNFINEANDFINEYRKKIKEIEKLIQDQEEKIKTKENQKKDYDDKLNQMKIKPVEQYKEQIRTLGKRNNEIRENNELKKSITRQTELEKKITTIAEGISRIEKKKSEEISRAKLPVEGLSFNDDEVFFQNLPFNEKQQSRSNILKISLAIGMHLNPTLKVLTSKNGNELDEDNMKLVSEMISGKDYQLWLEKVDSSGKVGIHIEDGEIVSINGIKIDQPEPTPEPEKKAKKPYATSQKESTEQPLFDENNELCREPIINKDEMDLIYGSDNPLL